MGRLVSNFFNLIVVVVVIVFVAYVGISIFANCQPDTGEYRTPKISQAQYEIVIVNTNSVIYTDEYEAVGTAIVVESYWELKDDKFRFIDSQITLDRSIFGTITVRRR